MVGRALLQVFVALSGAYGLSLTGFLTLRAATGEAISFVALMSHVFHLMMMLSLALLPIMVLLRRWIPTVTLIMPVLFFSVTYGPMLMPKETQTGNLTVMTYNLGHANLNSALSLIRDANADIVLVQELGTAAAAELSEAGYPHLALHPQPIAPQGQGVLSRYPITEDAFWTYDGVSLGQQRVELALDDTSRIVVYNVHLVHPGMTGLQVDPRGEQLTDLLNRAGRESVPVLLAGDFNLTDQTTDYERIRERYEDAFLQAGAGLGYTFPDQFSASPPFSWVPPLARIDFVFYDNNWSATQADVWPSSGGSDHRPLWVDLALTGFQ